MAHTTVDSTHTDRRSLWPLQVAWCLPARISTARLALLALTTRAQTVAPCGCDRLGRHYALSWDVSRGTMCPHHVGRHLGADASHVPHEPCGAIRTHKGMRDEPQRAALDDRSARAATGATGGSEAEAVSMRS